MSPNCDAGAATKPTNKRLRDSDEETAISGECAPPEKRAKKTASNISQPLTAESLKRHTLHEDLDTVSQITQKSSFSASHYRNSVLKDVNICFQFRRVPDHIRNRFTTIIQAEVSPDRKKELSLIAQTFQDDFADVLDTAAREDDCLELFYQALSSMGYNESLAFRRKAGMTGSRASSRASLLKGGTSIISTDQKMKLQSLEGDQAINNRG
ncbi:MAG: hypothetical protein Q9160_003113 [Pyrenula sp. 1 TL-2023]